MTLAVGPLACLTCKRPVVWDRVGASWRLMERRGNTYQRHACSGIVEPQPAKPAPLTCGAWMPVAREHCARKPGHVGTARYPDHRTRYALDCANALHARSYAKRASATASRAVG